MSRPRSRSPRYRRFPWEEPGFDAHRLLAELDGIPMDRSHHFREGPEEPRDYFRKEMYPEGQRRSPSFPEDHQFGRRPDQEEFYHRGLSPHHGSMRYEDRRLPLPHDGGNDVDRRRGGFREHSESFETRTRSPQSPLRLQRERLTPTPRPHSAQRESGKGWRGEEPGRGRGRLRDLSPGTRSDDPRAAADRERGRKSTQGSNRGRQRENPHHERNLPFKRQRREMDDVDQLGYREEFGEQGYSVDSPGDGYGGDTRGKLPLGDVRRSRPVVIEHGHGITGSREVPRWEQFDNRRDRDPDFDRQRSPRPMSTSQERFRMSDSRMDGREDTRERHFQDNTRDSNFHETRRSPVQDRPNTTRFDNRVGPMNHRGRGSDRPLKRNYNQVQGGRIGQCRSQPRLQKGYQERPHEDQRPGYRPFREDYDDHIEVKPSWAEEHKVQQWDRPGSLDRHLQRVDLDPKMPRQRLQAWGDQKTDNTTVVTEETLTIKVDMSRPVNQNSSLCYSSDRQLSLDLVNVGRQRLDFLPMLEHSGTYRETAMHTGTFAQEIITLVHLVKDQYFRDDGVTLNERFSAPQKGAYSEEEMEEELTLDQRFSSNRGFSLDMSSLLHDDEPLFSRLGPMQGLSQQPIRGPGDLRHDLERRRQEKLEGVKVTIPGNSMSQRPLGPVSELDLEYSEQMSPMDHEGFSNWPEEQNRRRDGNMGPRRGPSNRLNTGPQRRNNRFGNRRPNAHSSSAGPSW